ncbi:MAG: DUF2142 domain-containing protein [Oscillospiraceae bacterium]|nr:DUF2142 domain-containing protein [Oscillospiraceae bacterium]
MVFKENIKLFFKKRENRWLILSILMISLFFLYYGCEKIGPEAAKRIPNNQEYNQTEAVSVIGEIRSTDHISQITPIVEDVYGVRLRFGTYARNNTGTVVLAVYDDNDQCRYETSIPAVSLEDNTFYDFVFDEPISPIHTDSIELVITSPGSSSKDAVTLYYCTPDAQELDEKGQTLYLNGDSVQAVLAFELFGKDRFSFLWGLFLFIYVVIVAAVLGLYWVLCRKKKPLEYAFAMVALLLGLVSNIVFPTFSIPDEPNHFNTAYHYSNMLLGQEGNTVPPMVKRSEDIRVMSGFSTNPTKENYGNYFEPYDFFVDQEGQALESKDTTAVSYPFWGYLPQIVGLALSRLLCLGTLPMLFLSRLLSSCVYVGLTFLAIRKTPVGKLVFCIGGLLPMTLHLSASFSFDTMCIGLSFLLTAWLLQLIYQKKQVDRKDIWGCAILTLLLAPCKLVYLVLIFMCVLIPWSKMGEKKKKWKICAVWSLLSVISAGLFYLQIIINTVQKGSQDMLASDNGYSLTWILNHLGEAVGILIRTVVEKTNFYVNSLVGSSLGWLDTSIHQYWVWILIVCLFLSVFPTEQEKEAIIPTVRQKIWILLVVSAGILLAILTMFVSWTSFGSTVVNGVQGRYFIPFLPLILLLFRGKGIVLQESTPTLLLYVTVTVTSIAFLESFAVIATR